MKNKIIDLKNGVILVQLNHGKNTLISKEDIGVLSSHWIASRLGGIWYATRGENYKRLTLHRVITNALDGMEVDHIDGNGLNNIRTNLRICTHAQNSANRKISINNTTGFKGVRLDRKRYRAFIEVKGIKINLGSYPNARFAAIAYNAAAIKYFGEYANLNDVD